MRDVITLTVKLQTGGTASGGVQERERERERESPRARRREGRGELPHSRQLLILLRGSALAALPICTLLSRSCVQICTAFIIQRATPNSNRPRHPDPCRMDAKHRCKNMYVARDYGTQVARSCHSRTPASVQTEITRTSTGRGWRSLATLDALICSHTRDCDARPRIHLSQRISRQLKKKCRHPNVQEEHTRLTYAQHCSGATPAEGRRERQRLGPGHATLVWEPAGSRVPAEHAQHAVF